MMPMYMLLCYWFCGLLMGILVGTRGLDGGDSGDDNEEQP